MQVNNVISLHETNKLNDKQAVEIMDLQVKKSQLNAELAKKEEWLRQADNAQEIAKSNEEKAVKRQRQLERQVESLKAKNAELADKKARQTGELKVTRKELKDATDFQIKLTKMVVGSYATNVGAIMRLNKAGESAIKHLPEFQSWSDSTNEMGAWAMQDGSSLHSWAARVINEIN